MSQKFKIRNAGNGTSLIATTVAGRPTDKPRYTNLRTLTSSSLNITSTDHTVNIDSPVVVPTIAHVGVNIAGAENNGAPLYVATSVLDYYISKGINHFRLCLGWENAQAVLNGPLTATYMTNIDIIVNYITSKGCTVNLDLHNFGTYNSVLVGTAPVTNAAFAYFWGLMATHYKNNPLVMFGLMNEPAQSAIAGWVTSINLATAAIRAVGATQTIIVPGSNGDQCLTSLNPYLWLNTLATTYVDPFNNWVLEGHQYFDSDQSGTHGTVLSATIGTEMFGAFLCNIRALGIKFYYGEYNVGIGGMATQCLDGLHAKLAQNGDVVFGVAMWGGGDFASALATSSPYIFGLAPFNGQDVPQLVSLQSLLPGGKYFRTYVKAPVAPFTMSTPTYSNTANISAWGGFQLSAGSGTYSAGYTNYGLAAGTIEALIICPTGTPSGTMGIYGGDAFTYLTINTSGQVVADGLTSTTTVNDGLPHHIAFSANGTNSWLYVDGVLQATQASSPVSFASPGAGFPCHVMQTNAGSGTEFSGSVIYCAEFGYAKYTGNSFTPIAQPYTAGQTGMISCYTFNGTGGGYS